MPAPLATPSCRNLLTGEPIDTVEQADGVVMDVTGLLNRSPVAMRVFCPEADS